ncbi:MAG: hypothetical protein J3R72DRAFT_490535 [Linnemannia gamsii]|nr:MAG: hypothetical protein J3R72DRAFT_490535 [Linnemannia gamsii]
MSSNSNFDQPYLVVVNGYKKTDVLLIHINPSQTVLEFRNLIKAALCLHPKFDYFECLGLNLWKVFLHPRPLYKEMLGISSEVVALERAIIKCKLQLTEKVGDVLDRSVYDVSLGLIRTRVETTLETTNSKYDKDS